MRRRVFEAFGIAVVMTALAVFLQSAAAGQAPAPGGAAGTASAGTGKAGPAPQTPWGHPDLQGIWLDEFDTPFERPAQNADKEFFTEEERKARDQRVAEDAGRNERANRGSAQDVAGAYNAVFTSAKPTGRRTSLVVDPPNGRIPDRTAEALERSRIEQEFRLALLQNTPTCKNQAAGCRGGSYGPPSPRLSETPPFYNTGRMNRHDGPEDQSLGDRCMLGTTPDFNGFRRIVQGPNVIAIGVDTGQGQGYQRIVYLSGSHPPQNVRLRHGDSRGHFEGQTLIVETTNFSPKFPYRGAGENLTLVERFTRLDARTLEYAATITDPTVWTAPWTVKQELTLQSDEQNRIYYEPRCHEGNYGLPSLLVGARLDDKAFREGKGPNPASQDTATCVNELPAEREN
jgi:hypothetical protein